MVFMTRKRFEEEVQRRMWEEEQKRDMREDISKLWGRTYKLEERVEQLERLLENKPVTLEAGTCDDKFFVEPPVGNIKPL